MPRWFPLVLALAVAGCDGDPDEPCPTEPYRTPYGLAIDVAGADEALTYDFLIEADGLVLVLRAPPDRDATMETGDGDGTLDAFASRDGATFSLLVKADGPPWDHWMGPETAVITASTDGVELLSATFTPTYEERLLDGDACPAFQFATATMELP